MIMKRYEHINVKENNKCNGKAQESQEGDVLETEPAWDRLIESVNDVKPAR